MDNVDRFPNITTSQEIPTVRNTSHYNRIAMIAIPIILAVAIGASAIAIVFTAEVLLIPIILVAVALILGSLVVGRRRRSIVVITHDQPWHHRFTNFFREGFSSRRPQPNVRPPLHTVPSFPFPSSNNRPFDNLSSNLSGIREEVGSGQTRFTVTAVRPPETFQSVPAFVRQPVMQERRPVESEKPDTRFSERSDNARSDLFTASTKPSKKGKGVTGLVPRLDSNQDRPNNLISQQGAREQVGKRKN